MLSTRKALSSLSILCLAVAGAARTQADTILLISGDTFTGTITHIDAQTVDVDTPFAGPIKVKRDTVRSLRSNGKVTIAAADGAAHTAFVAPAAEGDGWHEVEAAAPPAVPPTVAAASPAPPPAPVPAAPEKLYNVNLEPFPIGPHWKDQFTLGIVNTTGNTESTNFAAELDFNYKEKPHELALKIGGVYDTTDGAQTAGQFYFDTVYRRLIPEWDKSERWYFYGENHELYDAVKAISMRSTSSVGLGYFLIKSDKLTLDLRAGPAYVWERFFSGDTDSNISGLIGLRAAYILNDHISLTEEALYTTAFADVQHYQLTSETALNVKLPEVARGVGMKLAFRDDYDNATQRPRKNNDTRLTLSMTLDF